MHSILKRFVSFADVKRWKAGSTSQPRLKKKERSWSRLIHVLRSSAVTSVDLQRYRILVLITAVCRQSDHWMALQSKRSSDISLRLRLRWKELCKLCTCTLNFLILQVDAEQYYSELEEKRTDEFNAEKNHISMKRLGIAFVTFRDERMTAVWVEQQLATEVWASAPHENHHSSFMVGHKRTARESDFSLTSALLHRIVKDYGRVHCRRRPQQSSITTVVQPHKWGVSYAPAPSDIIWSVPLIMEISYDSAFSFSNIPK